MSFSDFFKKALILLAVLSALVFGLSFIEDFKTYQLASWSSIIYMFFTVLISFFFMKRGMKSEGHSDFMKAMGTGFGVKLLLAIGFLVGFKLLAKPESKLFVLPFFTAYFVYTFLLINAVKVKVKKD